MSTSANHPSAPPDSNAELSDQQPLLGYQNPYLEKEIEKNTGDNADNASIMSEEAAQVLETKNQEEAKKEEKPKSGGDASALTCIIVLTLFVVFDCGKLVFEGMATKGTTIVINVFNIYINMFNVFLAFTLTVVNMGWKNGTSKMFDLQLMKGYIAPAACFSVSQLFSLLQNNFLSSASVRKVLNNLRILLTAMFTRMVMGTGYTQMQWCLIVTIVLVTFQFLFLTSAEMNPFVGNKDLVIGMVFNLIASLAAVFGSLLGEKHMKANKHLPFYLQNFQFSLPTMCFSIIGLVTTNGFAAILGDCITTWMNGDDFDAKKIFSLNGKNGLGTQLISASRTGFFTYTPAFTSVEQEVKYYEGTEEKKFLFTNRFNLAAWDQSDDRTGTEIGKLIQPVLNRFETTADDHESYELHKKLVYQEEHMIYNKVAAAAVKYAQVMLMENNIPRDTDLSDYNKRAEYLPGVHSAQHLEAKKKKNKEGLKKHKAAPFPYVNDGKTFDRSASDRYRELGNNLIYDTKFTTSQPYKFEAKATPWPDLKNKFALYMGLHQKMPQTDKDSEKKEQKEMLTFSAFSLFRRDSPHYRAMNMAKPKEEDCKEVEVQKGGLSDEAFKKKQEDAKKACEDKKKTWKSSSDYFKLTEELKKDTPIEVLGEDGEVVEGEYVMDDAGQQVLVPAAYEAMRKHLIKNKDHSKDLRDRLVKLENQGRIPAVIRTQAWEKSASYLHEDIKDKKAVAKFEISYKRTVTDKISLPAYTTNPLDVDVLSSKIESTFTIPFLCGDYIDYSHENAVIEGHMGKKFECSLREKAKDIVSGKIKKTVDGETVTESFYKGKPAAKVTFVPAAGEPQEVEFTGSTDGFNSAKENFLRTKTAGDNKNLYFMHEFTEDGIVAELLKYQDDYAPLGADGKPAANPAKPAFYTYPGEAPAGVCTYDACYMEKSKQDRNGIYYLLGRAYYNPNKRTSPFDQVAKYGDDKNARNDYEWAESAIANPFLYGIIHGYTRNPTPPAFFFTLNTLVAATCNIGQSWMSALTSKVLSSLWKTIASGVAFAILPILESTTMDAKKRAEVPWFPLFLGVITTFLTVYLFQLAPKPPKKEEAPKDLEAGKK